MLKRLLIIFALYFISLSSFAITNSPNFVFLPNIKTQYLMSTNAVLALQNQNEAIELVKKTLNITSMSPYKTVKIRFIYNEQNLPQALIVYLLSAKYKSFELVKLNLDTHFNVTSVTTHYRLTLEDLTQSPYYAYKKKPQCPDDHVQFVIGNNFYGDESVEKEVQSVYQMATAFGYNPVLLDTNNSSGLQPTVQAYENWLSCPNVKGFYNESHGNNDGILVSDGELIYRLINKDLANKLTHEVALFDSCDTFQDPLLSSMINIGKAQQYIAGIIPLPFGSSERTASCIWSNAFNHQQLTQKMIEDCANQFGLEQDAFRIGGSNDNFLHPAG